MLELKIILALTAREFDFILEYPGEQADVRYETPVSIAAEVDENTEYGRAVRDGSQIPDRIEGHRSYPVLCGTAKPVGGCPGRLVLREKRD